MRRYQYRLNDQNISQAGWGAVTPLKYIETVPGETYGGTISVNAGSALTSKMIKSRAYYDLYAFYCPIRLLWREFPEFLASSDGDIQPPQSTTLFPQNFENDFTGGDGTTDTNAAFLRRMYHMVYFSFFASDLDGAGKRIDAKRVEMVRDGDYDDATSLLSAHARSSTFDESWFDGDEIQSQQIEGRVVGSQSLTSLDDVRRAYALDRWEKIRDYYGGRYTDLLKGYGVKADWGVLQEPECIGISNNDFTFKPRSSSGDTNFGDRRGFFEGEMKLKLRKTFTPEHGIIAIFAVPRADVFNSTQGSHILCSRDLKNPTVWWDPVSSTAYNQQTLPKSLIDTGAQDGHRVNTPIYEHLRKGRNEMALAYDQDWSDIPAFSKTMTSSISSSKDYTMSICRPNNSEFEGNDGGVTHYTEVRVAKRSPIKPAAVTTMR